METKLSESEKNLKTIIEFVWDSAKQEIQYSWEFAKQQHNNQFRIYLQMFVVCLTLLVTSIFTFLTIHNKWLIEVIIIFSFGVIYYTNKIISLPDDIQKSRITIINDLENNKKIIYTELNKINGGK